MYSGTHETAVIADTLPKKSDVQMNSQSVDIVLVIQKVVRGHED